MLNHWLSPTVLKEDNTIQNLSKEQFGRNIAIYLDEIPNLEKVDLALIGISQKDADQVRSALYQLDYPFNAIRIADLGNIRNEDPSFIIPILKELLQSNIIPILIGRHPESSYAQFQAYNTLKRSTNLVCIDEKIRFSHTEDSEDFYLNNIINAKNSNLFHLSVLGFQSHFTSDTLLKMMDEYNYDYIRLGKVKGAAEEIEPLIRDADMLCFNLEALKYSDAPGVKQASPSGLFSEEACQLSRYAGISDKLTSIGFYGYQKEKDHHQQTSHVIAQLIWYFLDGFYHRMNDFPVSMNGLVEYIVEFKHIESPVTFWKSNKSGRWWMQVPVKTSDEHQRHQLVPCSYNDYLLASNDNFPDRLLNAVKRFN